MIRFGVRAWSAWAPNVQSQSQWRDWAAMPRPLELEGMPELAFVPALQRRRFSRLSRMALQVAFEATPPSMIGDVSTVFASRHGEATTCVALLSDIARELPLSPTAFSHSVHNAQAGLFSIQARNGRTSSSIAAMRDTFCAGLIEAFGVCERRPDAPTLLVQADEPRPAMFSEFEDEIPAVYAVALLITIDRDASPAFGFEIVDARAAAPSLTPRIPEALQFLAWVLGDETSLTFAHAGSVRQFTRFPS